MLCHFFPYSSNSCSSVVTSLTSSIKVSIKTNFFIGAFGWKLVFRWSSDQTPQFEDYKNCCCEWFWTFTTPKLMSDFLICLSIRKFSFCEEWVVWNFSLLIFAANSWYLKRKCYHLGFISCSILVLLWNHKPDSSLKIINREIDSRERTLDWNIF